MTKYLKNFELFITIILMVLMAIVVMLSVVDLALILYRDIITPPILVLDTFELLDIFSMFLLVLIGIELIETLKAYMIQNELRAEIIILVAIIALARKIITLDLKEVSSGSLLGIAATMLALSIAYFIIRQANKSERTK
ncbi:MAG: phosphate-starvation-inducible PsiE family protein [Bacteriovorax sp.]|nr:phosphate-starvation-inducible PsiE family protein [Bacteriovorax sp.]